MIEVKLDNKHDLHDSWEIYRDRDANTKLVIGFSLGLELREQLNAMLNPNGGGTLSVMLWDELMAQYGKLMALRNEGRNTELPAQRGHVLGLATAVALVHGIDVDAVRAEVGRRWTSH